MNPTEERAFHEWLWPGRCRHEERELVYEKRHGAWDTFRCKNPDCKYHNSENGVPAFVLSGLNLQAPEADDMLEMMAAAFDKGIGIGLSKDADGSYCCQTLYPYQLSAGGDTVPLALRNALNELRKC
jgi:hypothetical protein